MSRLETFTQMSAADAADWIGRSSTREGILTPELAGMLGAALGHVSAAQPDLSVGAPMPRLWHWAAFPEFVPLDSLGEDGHPALGKFLPPLKLPRRMWAAGNLTFEGDLHVGEALRRHSEIVSLTEKQGASGPMVFVAVAHVIEGARGGRIEERQDIVYLDMPKAFTPPKRVPVPYDICFDETVPMNEARLFRYSAATYNAHRIHYDLPYARDVEKYPALVVHGPMQATLVLETAERRVGRTARRFRFRSIHPMFHDSDLRLVGRVVPDASAAEIGTASPAGYMGLQARMEWGS
jgi:3-methylfumaryl-CoA hydratase